MMLFPYAKDIEYKEEDKSLKFTLTFYNESQEANINIQYTCDSDLSHLIEDILNDRNLQERVS
jgi:hypothetical protein